MVKPGLSYEVDWNRPGIAVLEGSVTYRNAPAEGIYVSVERPGGNAIAGGYVEKDGRYRIQIPETGTYRVRADKMGTKPIPVSEARVRTAITPGNNHLDLALPGGSISGVVLDKTTGKPVEDSTVAVLGKRPEVSDFGEMSKWHPHFSNSGWSTLSTAHTDAAGRFTLEGLPEGELQIRASGRGRRTIPSWGHGVYIDGYQSTVAGPKLSLEKDQQVNNVVINIPEMGSARIRITDARTGKPFPYTSTAWLADSGIEFYPETIRYYSQSNQPTIALGIAPGHYTVSADAPQHYAGSAEVEIKPGVESSVSIKLEPAQSMVFQLDESPDAPESANSWTIGYNVTAPMAKPGVNKPPLENAYGTYSGSTSLLWGDPPRKASVVAPTGMYDVDLMLARETYRNLEPQDIVWTGKRRVTVEPGKDTVITIPFRELGLEK